MRLFLRGFLLLLAMAFLAAQPTGTTSVGAFDTLHHRTASEGVLRKAGFGDSAVSVATIGNWYVELYVNARLHGDIKKNLAELHFDNLDNLNQIEDHFKWMETITKRNLADLNAGGQCNPFGILMLTGVIFHAIQDFYSHSNWAKSFLGDEVWSDWTSVALPRFSGLLAS